MSETLPRPHSVSCTVTPPQAPVGTGLGWPERHRPWGMGLGGHGCGGVWPRLWPGSSHILWTGVVTLSSATTLPSATLAPRSCPVHLPEAPTPLCCQESGVGRELRGASGMSLSGASPSVPVSAEALGAGGGSPDLVWRGEAGSREAQGRAGLPFSSQVGHSRAGADLLPLLAVPPGAP